MNDIKINQSCPLCNGDGYMVVTAGAWKNYLAWVDDPTEDKIDAPDAFPSFLKNCMHAIGSRVDKDNNWILCPTCKGNKLVPKKITFDELKNLLK